MIATSQTRISFGGGGTSPTIQSLRPNVTREEAIRELSRNGVAGVVHRAAFGPLQSIADFYIPFRIFQVEIINNNRKQKSIFGLDAATGMLDLYALGATADVLPLVRINTRNHLPPALDDSRASELVVEKVRRAIFTHGFFRVRQLQINAFPLADLWHVPYWVGFYENKNDLRFSILDAVRRRFEGPKVRQLLQNWLCQG